jgi:hypothetical protein
MSGLVWLRRGMDFAQRSFVLVSVVGTSWVLLNVGLFAADSAKRRRVAAAEPHAGDSAAAVAAGTAGEVATASAPSAEPSSKSK